MTRKNKIDNFIENIPYFCNQYAILYRFDLVKVWSYYFRNVRTDVR